MSRIVLRGFASGAAHWIVTRGYSSSEAEPEPEPLPAGKLGNVSTRGGLRARLRAGIRVSTRGGVKTTLR